MMESSFFLLWVYVAAALVVGDVTYKPGYHRAATFVNEMYCRAAKTHVQVEYPLYPPRCLRRGTVPHNMAFPVVKEH